MRKDVEKIIYFNEQNESEQSQSAFKAYVEREVIGQKILNGIFNKTVTDENGVKHFILDDVEKRYGFLSDVYGCTAVFSLLNRMNVKLSDEQKNDLLNTILWVFQYIRRNGYTLDPYYNDKDEGIRLFDKGRPFIGAMTWSLSFFVSIKRAVKNEEFTLDDDNKEFVIKQIINIVNSFNDYSIHELSSDEEEGKCLGWSFSKDCLQPSLFYTYSVLEAYSDFEDSVILATFESDGDTEIVGDQELLERLVKDNTYPDTVKTFKENCMNAALNVWNKSKDYIKEGFIGDNLFTDDKVIPLITEKDILKSTSSNGLFNTLFVVFTAIYGYINKKNQDPNAENDEDTVKLMRDAIQNVQTTFEALSQKGLEYIVDTYSLLFQTIHSDKERERLYSKKLNSENIFDASIIPMLVKSSSMMAFYIQRYPQKQMSELFGLLFNNISENDWVWDSNKYNVKITERYLEAVADFYDYYDEYERAYVTKRGNNQREIEKRVNSRVSAREKELRKTILKELEVTHQQELEDLKSTYKFENVFREQVKDLLKKELQATILETIDNVILAHDLNKLDSLSSFEKQFEEKLKALALSYLDKYLRTYSINVSVDELKKRIVEDLNCSLDLYSKEISVEEKPLTDIINNKDKK